MYHIGVVGGRDFSNYDKLCKILDQFVKKPDEYELEVIIVSGGAEGADSLAERYAEEHNLKTVIFEADWSLGKKAGPLRNKKIVEQSEEIIAFWDGKSKGTKSTIELAKKIKKPLKIVKY